MPGILGPGVDDAFATGGELVRLSNGRPVGFPERVTGHQVTERPRPMEGEVGEVRRIMTSSHSEGDPVPTLGGDPRDDARQYRHRFGGRSRQVGVPDLDEEGGEFDRRAVVGRFVRGGGGYRLGALVEKTKGVHHSSRVRRTEETRSTPDVGVGAEVAERVHCQGRYVPLASVDGGKHERGTFRGQRGREPPVDTVVVHMVSGPAHGCDGG